MEVQTITRNASSVDDIKFLNCHPDSFRIKRPAKPRIIYYFFIIWSLLLNCRVDVKFLNESIWVIISLDNCFAVNRCNVEVFKKNIIYICLIIYFCLFNKLSFCRFLFQWPHGAMAGRREKGAAYGP